MSTPLYRDPHASVEERVENLLALMTLDEKLAQLSCLWSTAFVSMRSFDPNTVAEKMPHGIGQVTRIGASTGLHPQESATLMNAIQQVAVERTRLAFYDPSMRFVTEPGAFTFSVGASSVDLRVEKTIKLDGQVAEYRQREIVATQVGVA
ncbi:MAG: hypothetical protein ACJ797_09400 [Ktedonobacteraceae bacterium]